ncbi:hypothetical protein [Vibrio neptunius]|uniref:hypothetical protein n=1 Tax=Vibrio neptunius TaxID=170651 RepID=UPI003CE56FE8
MPVFKVTSRPVASMVAKSGRNIHLLSGGEVTVRFYGVNNAWEEETTMTVGDALEFPDKFAKFEIESEYQINAEFYVGLARMTRNQMDLAMTGTAGIRTGRAEATEVESMVVSDNRARRTVEIMPLNATIYVGSLGTTQNEKVPVPAGTSRTFETQGPIYAQLPQGGDVDVADIRIVEELN